MLIHFDTLFCPSQPGAELLQPVSRGRTPWGPTPRGPAWAPGEGPAGRSRRTGLSERAALRGALPRGQLPGQPVPVPAGPGVPSAEGRVLLPAAGPGHGDAAVGEEDLLPWGGQVEGQTCERFSSPCTLKTY